jgi:hypothetical protein
MIKKLPSATNRDLFRTLLSDLINPKHELALLSDKIEWPILKTSLRASILRSRAVRPCPSG